MTKSAALTILSSLCTMCEIDFNSGKSKIIFTLIEFYKSITPVLDAVASDAKLGERKYKASDLMSACSDITGDEIIMLKLMTKHNVFNEILQHSPNQDAIEAARRHIN